MHNIDLMFEGFQDLNENEMMFAYGGVSDIASAAVIGTSTTGIIGASTVGGAVVGAVIGGGGLAVCCIAVPVCLPCLVCVPCFAIGGAVIGAVLGAAVGVVASAVVGVGESVVIANCACIDAGYGCSMGSCTTGCNCFGDGSCVTAGGCSTVNAIDFAPAI